MLWCRSKYCYKLLNRFPVEDFLHVAVDDVREQDQAGVVVARYGTYDVYVTHGTAACMHTACTHPGAAPSGMGLPDQAQQPAVACGAQQPRGPETTYAEPELSVLLLGFLRWRGCTI